jgi:hypothetical protein
MPLEFTAPIEGLTDVVGIPGRAMDFDGFSGGRPVASPVNGFRLKWLCRPASLRELYAQIRCTCVTVAQETRGKAFIFVEKSEEQMFGSNIFIGEPIGFFGRKHEDASGFGAEGKIHIRRSGWASLCGGIDPLANDFRLCLGDPKGYRFFFAEQAQ